MRILILAGGVIGVILGLGSMDPSSAQDVLVSESIKFPHYELNITLLPSERRFHVTGKVRFPRADSLRTALEFYLSPKMTLEKVDFVEPIQLGPVRSLTSEDHGGDTKWIVVPTNPIPVGTSVALTFSYVSDTSTAPQMRIGPGHSFAGSGGELWYPQQSFSIKETGSLRFTVPAGQTVVSNGHLQSHASDISKGKFEFLVAEPSKFGFACGKYSVQRHDGVVPFSLYLLNPAPHADSLVRGCSRALDHLVNLFGPFPYKSLSIVEVDFPSKVIGTGEFGFLLADDSQLQKDLDLSYWVHEMGHQWWGTLIKIRSGTPGAMMLTEGIAQFGALSAIEHLDGSNEAAQFRLSGYKKYFDRVADTLDMPPTTYIPRTSKEIVAMHTLANSKGFILYDMLSRLVGRELFAEVLRTITTIFRKDLCNN